MPVNPHPVDCVLLGSSLVGTADQVNLAAGPDCTFEDVVQMQLGPTPKRVVDIPPVDRQYFQGQASELEASIPLRAITPMVGVV